MGQPASDSTETLGASPESGKSRLNNATGQALHQASKATDTLTQTAGKPGKWCFIPDARKLTPFSPRQDPRVKPGGAAVPPDTEGTGTRRALEHLHLPDPTVKGWRTNGTCSLTLPSHPETGKGPAAPSPM